MILYLLLTVVGLLLSSAYLVYHAQPDPSPRASSLRGEPIAVPGPVLAALSSGTLNLDGLTIIPLCAGFPLAVTAG